MQIALVLICLVAGYSIKTYKEVPISAHKIINSWIIYVALPCVTLKYMPHIEWNKDLFLPISMAPILFFFAWFLLFLFNRFYKKLDKQTFGAVLLTMALGNTSFMGFPLTKAYFGTEGFKIAVICDEANFMVMSTLGIVAAIFYGNKNKTVEVKPLVKSILLFPPFIALILSISLFRFFNIDFAMPLLDTLSATLIPLALFSIGLQLDLKNIKQDIQLVYFSLAFKLILAPLVVFGLVFVTQTKGTVASVSIFEAAMAPMATTAILASEYGLNTRFVNNALSIGIIVSIFSTYLWYLVL